MKRSYFWACILALGMAGLGFAVGKDWGYGAAFAASVYAVLIGVFLAAQVYGFVLSQVKYSDAVEQAKYKVLEAEGIFREEAP